MGTKISFLFGTSVEGHSTHLSDEMRNIEWSFTEDTPRETSGFSEESENGSKRAKKG